MRLASLDIGTTANQDLIEALNLEGFATSPRLRMVTIIVDQGCTLRVNGDNIRLRGGFAFTLDERVRVRTLEVVESGIGVYMIAGY